MLLHGLLCVGVGIASLAACRQEGRGTDRARPAAVTAPVPDDPAARPGVAAPSGSATVISPVADPPPVVRPPPGTDQLVAVPADIAGMVELREVVRGLSRPVLVTIAPGDPRKRLFVVEQHVGRIRIIESD